MPRFKSSYPEHQVYEDAVRISGFPEVATATGTGTVEAEIPSGVRQVLVRASIAPMLAVGDTFDLFVQTRLGTTWVDVIHFTRILGNGLGVELYDKITAPLDEGHFDNAAVLAADAQRNIIGDRWRVRWEIAGATPEFNFDCMIYPG